MYVKYHDIVSSGVQNVSVALFDLPKTMVFISVQAKQYRQDFLLFDLTKQMIFITFQTTK